jgi:hypothetical protein
MDFDIGESTKTLYPSFRFKEWHNYAFHIILVITCETQKCLDINNKSKQLETQLFP